MFTPGVIASLLKAASTSLNESANHVIELYAVKNRFLGPARFREQCERGALQWNTPYIHVIERLQRLGVNPHAAHHAIVVAMLANRARMHDKMVSHEHQLAKYRKKWKLSNESSEAKDYASMLGLNDLDE